jgi:hypothetical protein
MKCVGNDRDFCEICHGMTVGFHQNVSGSQSFREMCKQRRCFREMCQQWPMFSRNMSAVTEVITKCASNGFGFHEIQYISFNKMRWQGPGSPNVYFMQCVSNVQGFHDMCQQLAKNSHEICQRCPGISRNVSAKARNLGYVQAMLSDFTKYQNGLAFTKCVRKG